jgi:hypothetical protein
MKEWHNYSVVREPPQRGLRAIGYGLTIGVAACVVLVWLMMSPFLRCVVFLGDSFRERFDHQKNGRTRLDQRSAGLNAAQFSARR